MHVAIFSTKAYDRAFLELANAGRHELTFIEPSLKPETALLAEGAGAVCVFVNDDLGAPVLEALARSDVRLVALRCAGFNRVDVHAAARLGVAVARVPAYSPHAIAEHTLALVLTLNRRVHRAYNRVREGNFSLDGLLGFDLNRKTVGIVGTCRIGACVARIFQGFNCEVVPFDPFPSPELLSAGVRYAGKQDLLAQCDIVTLHCPLTPETRYLIDSASIARMKPGVVADPPAPIERTWPGSSESRAGLSSRRRI